jgi:hypothetical protein
MILDIRVWLGDVSECVARMENGSIAEGQQLWDIRGEGDAIGPTVVDSIQLRGQRIPSLGPGQTAKVTLTGIHVGDLRVGTILKELEASSGSSR